MFLLFVDVTRNTADVTSLHINSLTEFVLSECFVLPSMILLNKKKVILILFFMLTWPGIIDMTKHLQCLVLSFFGEYLFRSSCPELCYENGVLENFIKFTGKHMCWRSCYNTIAKLRPTNLLKERLQHRCCLKNFAKLSRYLFFGIPAND